MKKSNIILIGMAGAGKSTTGVVVAKILAKDFIDGDLVNTLRQILKLSALRNTVFRFTVLRIVFIAAGAYVFAHHLTGRL